MPQLLTTIMSKWTPTAESRPVLACWLPKMEMNSVNTFAGNSVIRITQVSSYYFCVCSTGWGDGIYIIPMPRSTSFGRMKKEHPLEKLGAGLEKYDRSEDLVETCQSLLNTTEGTDEVSGVSNQLVRSCGRGVIASGCCLLRVLPLLHFAFYVVSTWRLEALQTAA